MVAVVVIRHTPEANHIVSCTMTGIAYPQSQKAEESFLLVNAGDAQSISLAAGSTLKLDSRFLLKVRLQCGKQAFVLSSVQFI
jgi:hypothetical protein